MFNDVFNHPQVKKQVRLLKGKYQKTAALVRELELPDQDAIQKSINDGYFKAHRELINSIDPGELTAAAKKEVATPEVAKESTETADPAPTDKKKNTGKGGAKKKLDDLM